MPGKGPQDSCSNLALLKPSLRPGQSGCWDKTTVCSNSRPGIPGARLGWGGLELSAHVCVPFLLRCRISFASFKVTPAGATTSSFRGVITCGARNICL